MKAFIAIFCGIIAFFFHFSVAHAQDVYAPPPGGKCISKDQLVNIEKALKELDTIHKSPAFITTSDSIVIIHDWQGRVYVNSGSTHPIRFKLKLGDTIDRDMAVILPTQVYYREQPPDPMFRLRFRAQAGILAPQLFNTLTGDKQSFWDAGLGLDFFHLGVLNTAVYAGIRSVGFGPGVDLTKNFGITAGFALIYDGFKSSVFTSAYFSFN